MKNFKTFKNEQEAHKFLKRTFKDLIDMLMGEFIMNSSKVCENVTQAELNETNLNYIKVFALWHGYKARIYDRQVVVSDNDGEIKVTKLSVLLAWMGY